jgi:hypothetical protein
LVAATTLGLGAGQVSRAARSKRLVLPLLAVVVLGAGVFGAVAALGGRGGAETRASTSSDQGAVSPEAAAVPAPVLPDAAPAVPASTLPDAALAPADAEMAVVDEAVELLPNPAVAPQPPRRSPAPPASSARAAPVLATATSQEPATPSEPAAAPLAVSIDSTPSGAEVVVGGAVVGRTPYRGVIHATGADVTYVLRRTGYKPVRLTAPHGAPFERAVMLEQSRVVHPQVRDDRDDRDDRDESVNPFAN